MRTPSGVCYHVRRKLACSATETIILKNAFYTSIIFCQMILNYVESSDLNIMLLKEVLPVLMVMSKPGHLLLGMLSSWVAGKVLTTL